MKETEILNVEFVDPLRTPQWNDWVQEFDNASIFHTVEWARALSACYRYPLHYGVLRGANGILALLPMMEVNSRLTGRRGVSLPFSDECTALLAPGVTLDSIVNPMREFGKVRRWDYLELRGDPLSVPDAVESDQFLSHCLTMESSEELQFKKLEGSHRRNVRKAGKEDIEIHRFQSREGIESYYSLHCVTRQRQGVPPQPRRFFIALYESVIASGNGFVLLARFKNEWIAGAVYLRFGAGAVYKFGGSDFRFQHLRANNLLMWEAIRYLREEGVRQLSFGRTHPSNTGLLRFKTGWGAEEIKLPYCRIGINKKVLPQPIDNHADPGFASNVMRHLPIPVLRFMGTLAYRHMG